MMLGVLVVRFALILIKALKFNLRTTGIINSENCLEDHIT
jgi:hypothetical protein